MKDDGRWVLFLVILFVCAYVWNDRKTEGVYENNYISCVKPAGSDKWRNKWLGTSERWDAINEQEYQVSFAHQRVVTTLPYAFEDCTVYDRNNWACGKGPHVQVREGNMLP